MWSASSLGPGSYVRSGVCVCVCVCVCSSSSFWWIAHPRQCRKSRNRSRAGGELTFTMKSPTTTTVADDVPKNKTRFTFKKRNIVDYNVINRYLGIVSKPTAFIIIIIIIHLFQATRPIVKKRRERQTETDRTEKHTHKNTKEHITTLANHTKMVRYS